MQTAYWKGPWPVLAHSLSLGVVWENDSWVEPRLRPGPCCHFSSAGGPAAEPENISCPDTAVSRSASPPLSLKMSKWNIALALSRHSQDVL